MDGALLRLQRYSHSFSTSQSGKRGNYLKGGESRKGETERKDREVDVKAPESYSNSFV